MKRCTRRLQIESLEERRVFSGVPALSSLTGAAHTLYLDFDGNREPTWTGGDVDTVGRRTYFNVVSQPYDRDGNSSDFGAAEVDDIRKIWGIVAEDYSPFNMNVTTIAPDASTPDVIRIVVGGQESASYTNDRLQIATSRGASFMVDKSVDAKPLTNSGYSSPLSSTAYVFADIMTSDGLRLTAERIGNTAAHEAGHIIGNPAAHEAGRKTGLNHDTILQRDANGAYVIDRKTGLPQVANEYPDGNALQTPIMGNNLAIGKPHRWTMATDRFSASYVQDEVAVLTELLGVRPDEDRDTFASARPLAPLWDVDRFGPDGRIIGSQRGVISSVNDQDLYAFHASGGVVTVRADVVADADLDARLQIYRKVVSGFALVNGVSTAQYRYQLVTDVDPPRLGSAPYENLSAAWQQQLAAGDYIAVVSSHGTYGDLGQYTLTASERTASSGPALNAALATDAAIAQWVDEFTAKRYR